MARNPLLKTEVSRRSHIGAPRSREDRIDYIKSSIVNKGIEVFCSSFMRRTVGTTELEALTDEQLKTVERYIFNYETIDLTFVRKWDA